MTATFRDYDQIAQVTDPISLSDIETTEKVLRYCAYARKSRILREAAIGHKDHFQATQDQRSPPHDDRDRQRVCGYLPSCYHSTGEPTTNGNAKQLNQNHYITRGGQRTTRKEAKAILNRLGIANRFSLKTVNFNWDRRKVLAVKDWKPNFKLSGAVKEALKPYKVIVEFEGPDILFS